MKIMFVLLLGLSISPLAEAVGMFDLLNESYRDVIDDLGSSIKAKTITHNLKLIEQAESINGEAILNANEEFRRVQGWPDQEAATEKVTTLQKAIAYYTLRMQGYKELKLHQQKLLLIYTNSEIKKLLSNGGMRQEKPKATRESVLHPPKDSLYLAINENREETISAFVTKNGFQHLYNEKFTEVSFSMVNHEIQQLLEGAKRLEGIALNQSFSLMRGRLDVSRNQDSVTKQIEIISEEILSARVEPLHKMIDLVSGKNRSGCEEKLLAI